MLALRRRAQSSGRLRARRFCCGGMLPPKVPGLFTRNAGLTGLRSHQGALVMLDLAQQSSCLYARLATNKILDCMPCQACFCEDLAVSLAYLVKPRSNAEQSLSGASHRHRVVYVADTWRGIAVGVRVLLKSCHFAAGLRQLPTLLAHNHALSLLCSSKRLLHLRTRVANGALKGFFALLCLRQDLAVSGSDVGEAGSVVRQSSMLTLRRCAVSSGCLSSCPFRRGGMLLTEMPSFLPRSVSLLRLRSHHSALVSLNLSQQSSGLSTRLAANNDLDCMSCQPCLVEDLTVSRAYLGKPSSETQQGL
mmetsp:Transcript_107854/g.315280  ORF Transcript_107854/g.315280 Transcript_107854/m.315280 type:complete len:306 (-) Transcript_107854:466-1383(-)